MDIQPLSPLTRVVVLKNIPLSDDYEHSINWETASVQASQFLSRKKYEFTNLSPIKSMNTVRVDINAMELYDCNYIMFQNKNFLNKWFYAFIKNVNFINQNMSEIQFEIDVLQTWWYDFEFTYCFIEREHIWNSSLQENYGENIVEEKLATGDMRYGGYTQAGFNKTDEYGIVMWTSEQATQWEKGKLINWIYNGASPFSFPATYEGVEGLNNMIENITNRGAADSIISISMFPNVLKFGGATSTGAKVYSFETPPIPTSVGNYYPKNKKVLQYPFCKLVLSNNCDQNVDLRYEFLGSNELKYTLSMNPNMTAMCYPALYASRYNDVGNSVSIVNFPMCSFGVDTYKAWLAQNSGFMNLKKVGAGIGFLASAATGNALGIATSALTIANVLEETREHELMPTTARGSTAGNDLWSNGLLDFYCYQVSVTEDYAKIIDDYFSLYGYGVHQVKFPYCIGRKNWNYIKTQGCNISSAYPIIPPNDAKKICQIMDKGITFWHNWEVGNYKQDNPMVERPNLPGPYPPTLRGE